MGQRITRAKGKIKAARIIVRVLPLMTSPRASRASWWSSSWSSTRVTSPPIPEKDAVRSDLTLEAIRRPGCSRPLPTDGEVDGLLALSLLTEARRSPRVRRRVSCRARRADCGAWDAALILAGCTGPGADRPAVSAGQGSPGRYQILAAINAVHTSAGTSATPPGPRSSPSTTSSPASAPHRWSRSIEPSTLAELDGPDVALAMVGRLDRAATAPTARPAPTCYADSAAGPLPALRTKGHRVGRQHRQVA